MIDVPVGYKQVESPCQVDPDMWYSDNPTIKKQAKVICGSCPFKVECKKTAIDNNEHFGIWGGTDFSTYSGKRTVANLCRKRKHELPEVRDNNQCLECRRDSQREWQEKQRKQKTDYYLNNKLKKNRKPRKKLGDKCANGHLQTEDNTKTRSYDGALICTECLQRVKVRSSSQSGHGRDLNIGSSNSAGKINFRRLRA